MSTEIRNKEVTARKPHRCEWCDTRIEKGERCHSRTYVWDGLIRTGHSHADCWASMQESFPVMARENFDEWMPGDFNRGEVYA